MDQRLFLRCDPPSTTNDLHQHEEDAAAIEHRQREHVEDRKVQTEQGGQLDQRAPAVFVDDLASLAGDAHRSLERRTVTRRAAAASTTEPHLELVLADDERVPE